MRNSEDSYVSDSKRDVSVSRMPTLGKRDKLVQTTARTPSGSVLEVENRYSWEAADLWQERMEQWLYLRGSSWLQELLLTLTLARLWGALSHLLLLTYLPLGIVVSGALLAALAALVVVVVRSPGAAASGWLRITAVIVGLLA